MTQREKYLRLLKQNRFKVTAPRLEILRVLDESKKPLSPQEIHTHIISRKVSEPIDLATVYRVCTKLEEAGVLHKVIFGDEYMRFEMDRGHHHYIVCNHCGKTEEVDECGIEHLVEKISKRTGFKDISHDVMLRGTCSTCVEKKS
jgi:Fur family transcriptional regulator, ferric uptake regulator